MNKVKIIAIVIFSLFLLPLSWAISVFIHCKLKYIEFTFNSVKNIEICKELVLLFFLIYFLCVIGVIILFSMEKESYSSEVDKITNNIVTPKAVGQGQHGTSRWLTHKEFKKKFRYNEILKKKKKSRFKLVNKIISRLSMFRYKFLKFTIRKKKITSGGLVVGFENTKKAEKIYYIDDNIHSLIVGATRSGKSRSVVLQTIGNLALAEESMIISDPKSELYHYTSKYLKQQGYKIITIDFKNPMKSTRYNFLQPVIDAVNRNDYRMAEENKWMEKEQDLDGDLPGADGELDETTRIADMNVEGMPWYRKAEPLYPDSGLPKTEMTKKEAFRFTVSATLAGLLVGLILVGACAIFILFCTHVWLR